MTYRPLIAKPLTKVPFFVPRSCRTISGRTLSLVWREWAKDSRTYWVRTQAYTASRLESCNFNNEVLSWDSLVCHEITVGCHKYERRYIKLSLKIYRCIVLCQKGTSFPDAAISFFLVRIQLRIKHVNYNRISLPDHCHFQVTTYCVGATQDTSQSKFPTAIWREAAALFYHVAEI